MDTCLKPDVNEARARQGGQPWRGSYRRMSHRLIGLVKNRGARDDTDDDRVHLGKLMNELGEQSFGWATLLFAIVNLIPVPLGTNMVLAIPLVIVAVQMMLGYEAVRLPAFLANRSLSRAGMSRTIARMRPIFRRLERLAKERWQWIFGPGYKSLLGAALLVLAIALALPIPTSGWGPAVCIFIIGFGMIERDGGIVVFGLGAGVVSLFVVVTVAFLIFLGIQTMAGVLI